MKQKCRFLLLQMVFLLCVLITGCSSEKSESAQNIEVTNDSEAVSTEIEYDETNTTKVEEENILSLSDKTIKISADGLEATFQLYDTQAAEELYHQLPLTLKTENFRDAQWMFYPPEKLSVTDKEVYHNGKTGELSYYEPWGDLFILYEDFYAGDEMHRLGICINGIEILEQLHNTIRIEQLKDTEEVVTEKQIQVEINGTTLTARLEDNSSADALYEKLKEGDMTVQMSDYSNFEKVGSLGFDLPTNDTQITTKAGDIILYQGDQLVFYYDTNSWNFTRIGEFQNINQKELKELFGEDGITAVLSIRIQAS